MRKGIIVVDIPEYCDYCPVGRIFGVNSGVECLVAPEGECVSGYGFHVKRPDWCPIEPAPDKEQVYTARECISRGGINGALTGMKEPEVYDCYDCPVCGCQIVAQERLRDEREGMNECLKLP